MLDLRIDEIVEAFMTFRIDARKAALGNKAAGSRSRKTSLQIEKLLNTYRKESLETTTHKEHHAMREKLQKLASSLNDKQTFKVGDLIKWKDDLKNKRSPDYGEVAIVTEIFEAVLDHTEDSAGSAYFREPLDLKAGFVDDDGDFVELHFDSRRFQLA